MVPIIDLLAIVTYLEYESVTSTANGCVPGDIMRLQGTNGAAVNPGSVCSRGHHGSECCQTSGRQVRSAAKVGDKVGDTTSHHAGCGSVFLLTCSVRNSISSFLGWVSWSVLTSGSVNSLSQFVDGQGALVLEKLSQDFLRSQLP